MPFLTRQSRQSQVSRPPEWPAQPWRTAFAQLRPPRPRTASWMHLAAQRPTACARPSHPRPLWTDGRRCCAAQQAAPLAQSSELLKAPEPHPDDPIETADPRMQIRTALQCKLHGMYIRRQCSPETCSLITMVLLPCQANGSHQVHFLRSVNAIL